MLTFMDNSTRGMEVRAGRPALGRRSRRKRALDFFLAVLSLVFLAPGLLIIAGLLYAADGGPVIFRQKRIGVNGQAFDCLKFRTMRRDAEERLAEILRTDEASRIEWEETQKLKNDPRVHWIGKLLRISSLDELPQLVNVIRGEMSFVGPRPVVERELDRYGDDSQFYLAMTPGITGLWQISGRNETTYKERVALDVEYFHRQSVWLDITIMVKTIPVLLYEHTGR